MGDGLQVRRHHVDVSGRGSAKERASSPAVPRLVQRALCSDEVPRVRFLLRPSPLLSFMINFALSSCSCSVSPFLLHTNGLYSLSAWEHKQHPIVYPGSRALADRGHLLLLSVSPPTKRILNNLQFFEPGEKEELRRGSREWNDLPLLSLLLLVAPSCPILPPRDLVPA